MSDPIHIFSENPLEQIWTNLSSFESKKLAKKMIKSRAEAEGHVISEDLLTAKSVGLAYCLRNAREYLREPPHEWNKRILGTYYGIMSFIGAQLIADPTSSYDLKSFEAATKQGHGLGNYDTIEEFPIGQKVFVTGDGLFVKYLKYLGINSENMSLSRNQISNSDVETFTEKLVSLDDLLARIPEVAQLYNEVTDRLPLHVRAAEAEGRFASRGTSETSIEVISRHPITLEFLTNTLGLPLHDLQKTNYHTSMISYTGLLKHSKDQYWTEVLSIHKSVMATPCWIKPVLGSISEPLAIHFMTLYALSILVRYRPSLWREISDGDLDSFFALIRN
jgi:YaaC-like Protein